MPELRRDPVNQRWVIIATERGQRPSDFCVVNDVQPSTDCPFCEGQEGETPPEILSYRKPGTEPDNPGWWTRLFPDKNPILDRQGSLKKIGEGMYDMMSGVGIHELIVETPDHKACLSDISLRNIEETFAMLRRRILDIHKDNRIKFVMMVKNYGSEAGSRFLHGHSHSHLLGLPMAPKRVQDEMEGAQEYFDYRDRCVFCDIISQEINDKLRIVMKDENIMAYCPYASRAPYETHIMPVQHSSNFERITDTQVKSLARVLKSVVSSVDKTLSSPAYNIILHTGPIGEKKLESYHWHFEFMPRITKTAGFEWGTGFYINPTSPEEAAYNLRSNLPQMEEL